MMNDHDLQLEPFTSFSWCRLDQILNHDLNQQKSTGHFLDSNYPCQNGPDRYWKGWRNGYRCAVHAGTDVFSVSIFRGHFPNACVYTIFNTNVKISFLTLHLLPPAMAFPWALWLSTVASFSTRLWPRTDCFCCCCRVEQSPPAFCGPGCSFWNRHQIRKGWSGSCRENSAC